MRLLFSILSIAYIATIFLLADSPVVSYVSKFNPYSLLHIPLYGILTALLIFSFSPLKFKISVPHVFDAPNAPNDLNELNALNASTHVRLILPGVISAIVAIADEIYQSFIPSRDASITDVFLDLVGIILTTFLIYKFSRQFLSYTH